MLICGEIHYFRVPKDLWYDRLLKLKRSGANCVSTYIPWNWHNPREDVVDFDDHYVDWSIPGYYSRRLRDFLSLAAELGLKVVARPGPYICSEWDSGGHPNWLYVKTNKLRSLDESYTKYASKWYSFVMPIIAEYAEKGVISMLQVENEYFWGNEPYIEKLYEEAAKYVRSIPIVTNENWYLGKIPNTIDDYPSPWDIRSFDEKTKNYMDSQANLLKMFMEMEGGWFSSIKHGNIPTNRLELPAEWTEILVKTAIGLGLNNINIYMFHGGTNPGYYTGKYITTSYDFDAAVREWGELSERYFNVKRTFMFLNSFSKEIERTKPVKNAYKQTSNCSELFERVGDNLSILVLRNMSDFPCYQRIIHEDKIIPSKSTIFVKPRYAKLLIFNYSLENTSFKLDYTSAEVLLKTTFKNTHVLILYAEPGEETETSITILEKPFKIHTYGSVRIAEEHSSVVIRIVHEDFDNIVVLESANGSRLILVYTSRKRAERTWVIDDHHLFIFISNIYYVGSMDQGNDNITLKVELDKNSCGYVTLISEIPIEKVTINNLDNYGVIRIFDNIYQLYIPSELCVDRSIHEYIVKEIFVKKDPIDYQFIEINPKTPLEEAGFYDNGLFIYKIYFSLDKNILSKISNGTLAISNFNDYAVVVLNGSYLTSGYHYIEAGARSFLQEGVNEAIIILESTGHPNDGLIFVPNGINGDLYLEKREDIPLVKWRKIELKIPYSSSFDISSFLVNPDLVKQTLLKWRELSSVEVYDINSPGLYITEIYFDNLKGHYLIDPGQSFYYNHYYRILLFVNKEYLGPLRGPVDITKYLKPGFNELALFVEWGAVSPRLVNYEYKLNGKWLVQKDTYGIVNGWQRCSWENNLTYSSLPLIIGGKGGKVLWFKAAVNIEEKPDSSKPRYISINSSGLRLMVFINGNFIGRIYDESPVKSLYIPEPALRKGVNEIVLLGVVTSNHAVLESVKVSEYYVNKNIEIKLYYRK
ncbi:MAG: beta-galactosidase [Desulfurococcaceae archaeon]